MTRHTVALMGHAGSYTPWVLTEVLARPPLCPRDWYRARPAEHEVYTHAVTPPWTHDDPGSHDGPPGNTAIPLPRSPEPMDSSAPHKSFAPHIALALL